MPDRNEIAGRHGIPHLADQLVGDDKAALEADAAARAAIIDMLGGTLTYPGQSEDTGQAEPDGETEPVDQVQAMVAKAEQTKARRQAGQERQVGTELHADASEVDVMNHSITANKRNNQQIARLIHGITEDDQ